jgi:hypothetical protein|tara:strand:- start:8384 stop:9790 length:1407 start_codon:yes stop_codon:yes gene_type:complete
MSDNVDEIRKIIRSILDEGLKTDAGKQWGGTGAGSSSSSRETSTPEDASNCQWNPDAADSISSDWKKKTLIDVISGGGKSKKFDDVIPLDGGSVGIAHWAAGGLKGFIRDTGAPEPTGGVKDCSDNIASGVNASPDNPGCYYEDSGEKSNWVSKMKSWLSSNKDKQIAHWEKTKADKPAALVKTKGWNTSRQMAIAAGISNSLGTGGFKDLASKNGWDPEKTLNAYAGMSDHKQRRKDRIDKVFPCNESATIESIVRELIIQEKLEDDAGKEFSTSATSDSRGEKGGKTKSDAGGLGIASTKEKSSLAPEFRTKVDAVFADLESQGLKPAMGSAWRSPEDQIEKYKQGKSKVKIGTHSNVDPIEKKPESWAADVVQSGVGWASTKEAYDFFVALGKAAHNQGLVWGGDWSPKTKTIDGKEYTIGWDPAHIEYEPASTAKVKSNLAKAGVDVDALALAETIINEIDKIL